DTPRVRPSPFGTPTSTTMPVTIREPRGTTTRAPTRGVSKPSGIAYVSRSSLGTGTATWMNNVKYEVRSTQSEVVSDFILRTSYFVTHTLRRLLTSFIS